MTTTFELGPCTGFVVVLSREKPLKLLAVISIIIFLSGCGRNAFHVRTQDSNYDADSELDAYYTIDSDTGEQYEFDFGDDNELHSEDDDVKVVNDQPELPLDPPAAAPDTQIPSTPANDDSVAKADDDGSQAPSPTNEMSSQVTLRPTIYYLPTNEVEPFKSCTSTDIKSFRAPGGRDLVPGKSEINVCSKFYFAVQMEGSGLVRTRDGRELLINYVDTEGGVPRFKVVDRSECAYGLGKNNLCLQPFVSIAADRNRYNVGDVIYVPAVAKAKIRLPDGDIHRGFFIVTDTGGAINGVGRFDFFTGPITERATENPFRKLGLGSKSSGMTYQLVNRGSSLEKKVKDYYKGRQIIPYKE